MENARAAVTFWRWIVRHGTDGRGDDQALADARGATWITTRAIIAEARTECGVSRDLWRFAAAWLSERALRYRQSLTPAHRTQADAWTDLLDQADAFRSRLEEARTVAGPPLADAEEVDNAILILRAWLAQHRPIAMPRRRGRRDLSTPFLPILAALADETEHSTGTPHYGLLARFASSIFPTLPLKTTEHSLRTAIPRHRRNRGVTDVKALALGLARARRRYARTHSKGARRPD